MELQLKTQNLKLITHNVAMRDSVRNRPMKLPRPAPYRSLTLVVSLVVLVGLRHRWLGSA